VQLLSYFLGVDSSEALPQTLMAGDRNLLVDGLPAGLGARRLTTNSQVAWDETIHQFQGNATMGDGSIQQLSSVRMREQSKKTGATNTTLLVP
jgi:hypothetical protein